MHSPGSNLADAILVVHAALVFFNVGALPVIWVGHFCGWRFVRNFYFRIVHLVLIAAVAAESLLGLVCPLTTWEDALRSRTDAEPVYPGGFIARWLHRLLFYDLPGWVFTLAYILFLLLVVLTFYFVRPAPPRAERDSR